MDKRFYEYFSNIRKDLSDAPLEIKRAYNAIVKYYGVNSRFEFDFKNDSIDDLIDLTHGIYKSTKLNNVYYYGYEFKPFVDSNIRKQLIDYIRGLSVREFREKDKRELIEKPLAQLIREQGIQDIDFIIYPESLKSDLTKSLVLTVTKFFKKEVVTIPMIKNSIENIEFDYDRYFLDNSYKYVSEKFRLSAKLAIDNMMRKVKLSSYFHLGAQSNKYKDYFLNYLIFKEGSINLTKFSKGLIIDDICTTGATLNNIIRQVLTLNPNLELFIYSIIGKQ